MNLKVSDAKREEGFTLIELLVVVIIIGILAAIAIPVFLNQRERAWVRTAESDVRNAAIAAETVFTDGFEYPETQPDMGPPTATLSVDGTDATAPSEVVTISPLITLHYVEQGQAFCIWAEHDNVEGAGDPVATYKSDEGGIQAAASNCT